MTRASRSSHPARPMAPACAKTLPATRPWPSRTSCLENPRKAKEIAVFQLLSGEYGIQAIKAHNALYETAKLSQDRGKDTRTVPATYNGIETYVAQIADKILEGKETGDDAPSVSLLHYFWMRDGIGLYQRITRLSDDELDTLHLYLPVIAFGQLSPHELDTGKSVFNAVAHDLGVQMREHWTPDTYFFSQRTRQQLEAITVDTGLAQEGDAFPAKKKDLVEALVKHFAARSPETAGWLPGPMQFPAVDDLTPKTRKKAA